MHCVRGGAAREETGFFGGVAAAPQASRRWLHVTAAARATRRCAAAALVLAREGRTEALVVTRGWGLVAASRHHLLAHPRSHLDRGGGHARRAALEREVHRARRRVRCSVGRRLRWHHCAAVRLRRRHAAASGARAGAARSVSRAAGRCAGRGERVAARRGHHRAGRPRPQADPPQVATPSETMLQSPPAAPAGARARAVRARAGGSRAAARLPARSRPLLHSLGRAVAPPRRGRRGDSQVASGACAALRRPQRAAAAAAARLARGAARALARTTAAPLSANNHAARRPRPSSAHAGAPLARHCARRRAFPPVIVLAPR